METLSIVEFRKKFGKRIRQLRKKANMTQKELALKIGYKDKQIINAYEKDGANPTAFTLLQLSMALGVSLEELFDFSDLDNDDND